jgi:hypothetical protein
VRIVSSGGGCEEAIVGSLLEALQAREQAARTRVEALRAELDRLAERLAAEQKLLRRLEITRQTVIEVLAGEELPSGDAVGIDPNPETDGGAAAPRAGAKVPVFGQDGDGHRLPVAYRDVVEVLADEVFVETGSVSLAGPVGSVAARQEPRPGMSGRTPRRLRRRRAPPSDSHGRRR